VVIREVHLLSSAPDARARHAECCQLLSLMLLVIHVMFLSTTIFPTLLYYTFALPFSHLVYLITLDLQTCVMTSVYLLLSSLYLPSVLGKITIDNSQIASV
jgi:xanthine/uracil permease